MNSAKTNSLISRVEDIMRISVARVGKRLAYYADETNEWYWITVSDLRYAVTLSKDEDESISRDVYSHWCSATGKLMSKRSARKMEGAK